MRAHYFLASLCIKLVDLVFILLGPLVFPFAYFSSSNNHFPWWAKIWDNPDHGIDGEAFWAKKTVGWPYWLRCFWWTCIRNPTNGLSYIFALKRKPYTLVGNELIGDKQGIGGSYWIRMGWAWEYYLIKPYGSRCIRIRIGWKIRGNKPLCPFVFAINPFQPFKQ